MKLTLTAAEMLARWRLLKAIEPARLDCSVERTDGIDLDAYLSAEMRRWYLDLLDHAPASLLAPANIASRASVRDCGTHAFVRLPAGCRRVLAVRLAGWPLAVSPVADSPAARRAATNPYTSAPVAVAVDSGRGLVTSPGSSIELLLAAFDSGPESYSFDELALNPESPYPLDIKQS